MTTNPSDLEERAQTFAERLQADVLSAHQLRAAEDMPPSMIAGLLNAPWHLEAGRATAVLRQFAQQAADLTVPQLRQMSEADAEFIESRDLGDDLTAEAALPRSIRRQTGSVVGISIMGPLMQHASMFTRFFGIPTYEGISEQLRAAVGNQTVKAVLLHVDSPGGIVYGAPELAAEIRAAREVKPIVAMINAAGFSAAYYLASQASEIVITPSGATGSIGTVMIHGEISKLLEEVGEKVTVIRSPERKVEANMFEPLSETALAALQAEVDERTRAFQQDVADGRGIDVGVVAETFGHGATMLAREALRVKMVDRIDTLQGTLERLGAAVPRDGDEPDERTLLQRSDDVRRRQHAANVAEVEFDVAGARRDASAL